MIRRLTRLVLTATGLLGLLVYSAQGSFAARTIPSGGGGAPVPAPAHPATVVPDPGYPWELTLAVAALVVAAAALALAFRAGGYAPRGHARA